MNECNAHSKNTLTFKIFKTNKTPKYYGFGWNKQKVAKHKVRCITCNLKLTILTDWEDFNDVICVWS